MAIVWDDEVAPAQTGIVWDDEQPTESPENLRYINHSQANLDSGKAVKNPDGSVSTVFGTIINMDGRETLVPTVWDGKILQGQELYDRLQKEGGSWPSADSVDEVRATEMRLKEQYINGQTPRQPEPTFYDRLRGGLTDARAVAGEFAAGANRALTETLDFVGPDTVNSILRLSGSDRQVPTLTGALEPYGIQGGFMAPGTAREVVGALGSAATAATGMIPVARNVATLGGATAEFLGAGTAKPSATPLLGQVKEYLGAGPYISPVDEKLALLRGQGDVAGAGKTLDAAGNVVKDAAQKAAQWQGFDPGFVAYVKSAGPDTKGKMAAMLDIVEKRKSNWREGLDARPLNVLGDSVLNRVKVVREANRVAAVRLDGVADSLRGVQVDASPAVNSFLEKLGGMGVKFNPQDNTLSFQGSDLEGVKGPQRVLKDVLNRMLNTKTPDGYDVHRLKRFLDEQVSYGKNARGLGGKTEGILKTLRHDLDGILDTQFPEYNKVNTQYAETRGALDEIQDIAGKKFDSTDESASITMGSLTRRFLSNAQSNGYLRDAVSNLDSIARKYITPGKDLVPYAPIQRRSGVTPAMIENDDLIGLAGFADEMDRMFGPASGTSLFGDVDKAVQRGADTMTGNMTAAGMLRDSAAWAGKKAMGRNEQRAMKAMRELLNRGTK